MSKLVIEQLEEQFLGKTVKYFDEDANKLTIGEVVAVTVDHDLQVQPEDVSDYDVLLSADEIIIDDDIEEETNNESSGNDFVKKDFSDNESVDETEGDYPVCDDESKTDSIGSDDILNMDLSELKSFVKSNKIKIPFFVYKNVNKLREYVIKSLFSEKDAAKISKTEISKTPKKENKVSVKINVDANETIDMRQTISKKKKKEKGKSQVCAELILDGGGFKVDLYKKMNEFFPTKSAKRNNAFTVDYLGNFASYLGIVEKRDAGFFLKDEFKKFLERVNE